MSLIITWGPGQERWNDELLSNVHRFSMCHMNYLSNAGWNFYVFVWWIDPICKKHVSQKWQCHYQLLVKQSIQLFHFSPVKFWRHLDEWERCSTGNSTDCPITGSQPQLLIRIFCRCRLEFVRRARFLDLVAPADWSVVPVGSEVVGRCEISWFLSCCCCCALLPTPPAAAADAAAASRQSV